MVAVAVAVHGAVAADFSSWSVNLPYLLIEGAIAATFIPLLSIVIDRFFLPGTNIKTEVVRDRNVAAIAIVVGMKLFGALMITAALV